MDPETAAGVFTLGGVALGALLSPLLDGYVRSRERARRRRVAARLLQDDLMEHAIDTMTAIQNRHSAPLVGTRVRDSWVQVRADLENVNPLVWGQIQAVSHMTFAGGNHPSEGRALSNDEVNALLESHDAIALAAGLIGRYATSPSRRLWWKVRGNPADRLRRQLAAHRANNDEEETTSPPTSTSQP